MRRLLDLEFGVTGEGRGGFVVIVLVMLALYVHALGVEAAGAWRVVTKNAGNITAMYAAVGPVTGNVMLLHQTKSGPSNMTFPGLQQTCLICSESPNLILQVMTSVDCSANSYGGGSGLFLVVWMKWVEVYTVLLVCCVYRW